MSDKLCVKRAMSYFSTGICIILSLIPKPLIPTLKKILFLQFYSQKFLLLFTPPEVSWGHRRPLLLFLQQHPVSSESIWVVVILGGHAARATNQTNNRISSAHFQFKNLWVTLCGCHWISWACSTRKQLKKAIFKNKICFQAVRTNCVCSFRNRKALLGLRKNADLRHFTF